MTTRDGKIESARLVLKGVFGIVPIVAGLDKFLNLLADWPRYLSPAVQAALPVSSTLAMRLVGVVEVAAGLLVLSRRTTVGAYVVAAWLVAVATNLVLAGQLDVAVRDLAMAAAAFALARLSAADEPRVAEGSADATADVTGPAASERRMRAAR